MILFKQASALQKHISKLKSEGLSIGFVPTMGALHEGHLSLISLCRQQSNITVCSIFVNPTQFNDKQDFDKYPVTISEDILKLEKNKCDILFLPSVAEMYPEGTTSPTYYNLGKLENIFEGYYRPGHFQGVCQAVDRLLNIVQPHTLFLGQKDFQQCKVIEKLIQQKHTSTRLQIGRTTREQSGLALSSRNMRLTDNAKIKALGIYDSLVYLNKHYKQESIPQLLKQREDYLINNGFNKVDYVAIADMDTLEPVTEYRPQTKHVALVAAFIDGVRLIDNMILDE